ncbi:MAG: hypothetical protein U1G08_05820 [Verrucomicrobiota bacterium]
MDAEDVAGAWTALSEAVARRSGATPLKQDYIAALESRYRREFTRERSDLDCAFADAMRRLVKRHPDDLEAQTLFAEALMDLKPWDYWTRDRTPKPETEEILAALQLVLSWDPDHPGANHFFIQSVEAGPHPESGLPAADRLREYAPAAGHLVHIPSHVYLRVGQYHDAAEANCLAAKADWDYIRHFRALGFYPGVYYPHNLHFLWWAEVFEGRGRDVLRTARQAEEYSLDNACGPRKVLEAPRLRHLPWLTLVRFGRWDELLAVPRPADTHDFLVDRAMWHFIRGWVLASRRQAEAAGEEHLLSGIAGSDAARSLSSPLFPVTDILKVADRWLAARVAEARGDSAGMVAAIEAAVAAEDAIPYMEPSYWLFPVRPAFGAALLRSGQSVRAEDAGAVHRQFLEAWRHAEGLPDLAWY